MIEKENYFQQGLKYLEIHDLANAIKYFELTVQHQPKHIDVLIKYQTKKKITGLIRNSILGMALSWNKSN